MSSWASKSGLGLLTSCSHSQTPYPNRLEKVKFGVPLSEVCKNDIPSALLVLILKLNKEAPLRKDVFRAPGNVSAMKNLIHFLQSGRLVNVDNYSVYTIASVLKKFLRKIPGGIFGRDGEAELFEIVEIDDEPVSQERIHRLLMSLPNYTQRLLVLLFGTFRTIASNAEHAGTGMTSEALGVSVAPSFFQSCVSDGKTARMEDVLRFKVATRIMKHMIDKFAEFDLFGRENYEYYARVTGRVLRVQDEWFCSFRYPPPPSGKTAQQNYALQLALETEKTWLQCECERLNGLIQEESQSTPALLTSGNSVIANSAASLALIPEHSLLESCARLSVSLEGPGLFNVPGSSTSCSSTRSSRSNSHHMTLEELEELRNVNRYAESTKSLSYLPQVHERQTARMRTRSEWFLGARGSSLELSARQFSLSTSSPPMSSTPVPGSLSANIAGNAGLSASAESVNFKQRQSFRRSKHMHRSSSRRNKENGSRGASIRAAKNQNSLIDASGAAASVVGSSGGATSKRTKTRVVSFEQAATSSGNSDANPTQSKVCYFDHSKSVDQAVIVERRTEFNNSLSVDNDLLVHDWPMTILPPAAKSDVTPSKPPRI
ncbi:unconventional myosin-IXAb isoform X1 [Culicoides brevitarsis]|uniref:unconventional myosin-IXAb isoform X1 n=1 Tax=Culicoides brevitarsis TaxID=469753 RepID=UPI00307BC700